DLWPVHQCLRAGTTESLDGGIWVDGDEDIPLSANKLDQPMDGRGGILKVIDNDVFDALCFRSREIGISLPQFDGCGYQTRGVVCISTRKIQYIAIVLQDCCGCNPFGAALGAAKHFEVSGFNTVFCTTVNEFTQF